MSNFRRPCVLLLSFAGLALTAVPGLATYGPQKPTEPKTVDLGKEIPHRLATLPDYSVFDYLSAIDGDEG